MEGTRARTGLVSSTNASGRPLILLPYVSQPWRTVAIVLAMVVPLSRMYVGAHLPLDLIGGAALGVTAASAVNLLVGVRVLGPAEDTRVGPAQLDRYD